MSNMRPHAAVCLLLTLAVNYALCKEFLPILELNETIPDAGTLISDCDHFTVRGKVKKANANEAAYTNTNLYLQAVKDPSSNAWASQCRPDLTVCGKENRQENCYCESKDNNGYYHLVMKIMAKFIYSGGKLMLSWNDARSPYNPPITSNMVDYYPYQINKQASLTLEIVGANETILRHFKKTDFCNNESINISVKYTNDMRKVIFCVLEPEMNRSIQIKEENVVLNKSTDTCVEQGLDLDGEDQRIWTMDFTVSGESKWTSSFVLLLSADEVAEWLQTLLGDDTTGDETTGGDGNGTTLTEGEKIGIGIGIATVVVVVIVGSVLIWRRKKKTSENAQTCICCCCILFPTCKCRKKKNTSENAQTCICCCCILFPTCKCRKKKKTSKYDPNPITGTNQYEDIDYTYTKKTELSANGQNSLYANKNVIPNEVSSKDNKGVNPNDNKVVSIDFRQTITNADKVPDAYAYANKKHCTTINVA